MVAFLCRSIHTNPSRSDLGLGPNSEPFAWPWKDLRLLVYCYIKAFQPSRDVRLDAVDKWIGS